MLARTAGETIGLEIESTNDPETRTSTHMEQPLPALPEPPTDLPDLPDQLTELAAIDVGSVSSNTQVGTQATRPYFWRVTFVAAI